MAGWDSRVAKRPWVIIAGNDARIARTNDFLEKKRGVFTALEEIRETEYQFCLV